MSKSKSDTAEVVEAEVVDTTKNKTEETKESTLYYFYSRLEIKLRGSINRIKKKWNVN